MKRLHLFIEGVVQGVTFRESTRREAERHGVRGWVRNLPDGRVEALLEGPAAAVEAVAAWCHRGPPRAKVQRVVAEEPPATGQFRSFEVLR